MAMADSNGGISRGYKEAGILAIWMEDGQINTFILYPNF
jgi:hypothetical protein